MWTLDVLTMSCPGDGVAKEARCWPRPGGEGLGQGRPAGGQPAGPGLEGPGPRDVGEEAAGPKGDKDLPRQEPPAGGCGRC